MALSQIKCLTCGTTKSEREFLSSESTIYSFNKKIPLCKNCLDVRFRKLYNFYNKDTYLATKHFCMNFDIYFDEETYKKVSEKHKKVSNFITTYIININRNKSKFAKSSLDNPINKSENNLLVKENIEEEIRNFNVTEEMYVRWGRHYPKEDIEFLENKYGELIKDYPSERREEIEIIIDICNIELSMKRALERGDTNAHIKYMSLKSDKMDKLNVIPSKQKQYGEDKDMTFGNLIKTFEMEEPIPEISEEFKDVDKIEYMINRYFTTPIKKVFGILNPKYTQEDEVWDYDDEK